MKNWQAIILSLWLCSCSNYSSEAYHQQSADRIVRQYDKKIAKLGIYEYRSAEKGTPFIGNFKKYYITKKYGFCQIGEARSFFCSFMDSFLTPFNENIGLRPYLQNYPFSYRDIDMQIVFVDEKSKPLAYPQFWSVRKVGEYLYYEHFNPKINKSVAFEVEPIDRAFRIYRMKKYQET